MAEFDWNGIQRAKNRQRDKLAALPYDEKLRIAEQLHATGFAMKGGASLRSGAAMAIAHIAAAPAAITNSVGAISVIVLGANSTLVAFAAPRANRTSAGSNPTKGAR